jgi:hypothetical protein
MHITTLINLNVTKSGITGEAPTDVQVIASLLSDLS